MAQDDLIMLDDEIDEVESDNTIAIILSQGCVIKNNVLTIPRDEVIGYLMNILIQIELDNV